MNLIKALTPKDTEEIKPGLFIQKTHKGYRQVNPAAWDGKINWKNFILGKDFFKSLIWFAIILFLAWSYFHDTSEYREFYEEVNSNPVLFCTNVSLVNINNNEFEDTFTIQNNYGEALQGSLP